MDSKQRTYENVSLSDDHEESMSNTEVEESLMGDDKEWQSSPRRHRRLQRSAISSALDTYRWHIDGFLLLVIAGLTALLVFQAQRRHDSSCLRQVGGDYSGAGPKLATKIVKWEANMDFVPKNASEFFEDKTLALWNTLMPAGTGRGGFAGDTFFTTSMTHQLHCLYMMARIYSSLVSDPSATLPGDHHFSHCIDYLRQAVMCSADLSLEPHLPSDSKELGPLDGGWNGLHVCKDYSQVMGYLESQIADGVRVVLPIDD